MAGPAARQAARALVDAALQAVEAGEAVRRAVRVSGGALEVGSCRRDLSAVRRLVVVGAGKASVAMARAIEDLLGPRVDRGLVVAKQGLVDPPLPRTIEVVEAAHPVPDASSTAAATRLVELVRPLDEQDLVIFLLSGGASSLLTLPAAGPSLEQVQRLGEALLASGATITEINAVRKHLSQIKGGWLARIAAPAPVVSLILSDVVGSPVDAIGSGPTAPDPTTFADALAVLERHGLCEVRGLEPILDHLQRGRRGELPETPGADDPVFAHVHNVVVGSNELAAEAAERRARELGFNAAILSTHVEGEAREVGRVLAAVLKELALRGRPLPRPACLVVGGETTVTLRGGGRGGRNQELALAAALELDGLADVTLATLATDGNDGPTDAGGAVVDGTTVARAAAMGLSAREHLERNDAYPLFDALGDLWRLGPTGTNVGDLVFLLCGRGGGGLYTAAAGSRRRYQV